MKNPIFIILPIAILIGLAAGYIYWSNWGCLESCAITSSPVNSSLYGAMMGGLLGMTAVDIYKKKKTKE